MRTASTRPRAGLLLAAGVASVHAVLASGCRPAANPPPPPPPPAAAPAPPPPPAPKRCEALDEGCVASKETSARIGDSGWALKPPDGWMYAQEPTLMIATFQTAALAITVQPLEKEKKKAGQERDAGVAALGKRLEVTLPKRKIAWQKPDTVVNVGELKVSLYQLDDVARGARKGPLLVFSTKLSKEHTLVGAGFVDDEDKGNADEAIMKAIESLAPSAAAGGAR